MKIAVIGDGNVGMATFRELQNLNEINEIVLIGRNQDKVKAEVDDYKDSVVLRFNATPKLTSGGYEKVEGADIIILTAGQRQEIGQSRLELASTNVQIAKDIFTEVNKYNKDAIVIILSNPVDIITYEIAKMFNLSRHKVIGTGTLLDTARCIKCISEILDISPVSINMFVIGEHGDSSVPVLSSLRLMNMSLDEYLSNEIGAKISIDKNKIAENVSTTAGKLIKAKGYTAYGGASAATRLVYEIIHDSNMIVPVSVVLQGEYETSNVAISVPCIIGRKGIVRIEQMILDEKEKSAFDKSVKIIKEVIESVEKNKV